MKRRSLFVLLSSLTLALTSCGFPNIFEIKLKSITLTDQTEKTYCVGETYYDFANLTIRGKYSDGHTEVFELSDVNASLTKGAETFDPNAPFTSAGTYYYRVIKDSVRSNAITLTVSAAPVYVNSISISGESSVPANRTTDLTITVDPEDYTVDMTVSSMDTSVATVSKISKNKYRVTAQSVGNTSINFQAKSGETTYANASHNISVTENYATSISVASGANSVAMNSFINVSLKVLPADFSTSVTAISGDTSIATVEKISNTQFRINGVYPGTTSVTFKTERGPGDYITATHNITVTEMEKTTIAQTYSTLSQHINYKNTCPLSGSPKLLVIPVWFTDSSTYIATSLKETVRSDIEKVYFGSTADTGWNSVSSFYNQESFGELNLTGIVSEWYECNESSSTYRYDDEYATATRQLVTRAANWYFTNHSGESRKDYDTDNDGYLDGVMLIYAAADYQADQSEKNNMWAYCYWVQTGGSQYNPSANVFFWASYDFMYDSTTAMSHSGKSYNNGNCSYCNLDAHTYIHEMGHVFGLEDYYDYAFTTNPAGGFSMQDSNVGGHDPYSLMAMGWADPFIPTTSRTITIQDFQSSHELILLTPSWNSYNSPFDEYLLLELYTPTKLNEFDTIHAYKTGYPVGPSQVGIRVWHVDARLYSKSTYSFTVNAGANNVDHGLNNTSDYSERACRAGSSYQKYNILQLIRNSDSKTYTTNSDISNSDLFKKNDTFSTSDFYLQFARDNNGTLDNGSTLGWSFTVTNIVTSGSNSTATIQLTRA